MRLTLSPRDEMHRTPRRTQQRRNGMNAWWCATRVHVRHGRVAAAIGLAIGVVPIEGFEPPTPSLRIL